MSSTEEELLLRTARRALTQLVTEGCDEVPRDLRNVWPDLTPRGVFVTLTCRGKLRGCIGTFHPSSPLPQTVWEMACAAARDPRFVGCPVTREELNDLHIELSVLSPLERSYQPDKLEVGVHGMYIRRGHHSGCFLPQVASEHGLSAEDFLACCCREKAGLPADIWRDPKTEVYLFTVEKLAEPLDG